MADQSAGSMPASEDETRRMLELELAKLKSEASAARLEARAAEVEWILRRFHTDGSGGMPSVPETTARLSLGSLAPGHRFASWSDLRGAQQASRSTHPPKPGVDRPPTGDRVLRFDSGDAQVRSPNMLALTKADAEETTQTLVPELRKDQDAISIETVREPNTFAAGDDSPAASVDWDISPAVVQTLAPDDESKTTRRRPAAWLLSAAAHIAVILLLATIGLKTHTPKDQVALSASAVSSSEQSVQTFEIESSEPEVTPEVTEPTPSETEYEISPVGEMKVADFSPDSPVAPATAMASPLSSSSAASAMAMKSESTAKMEFCGVEGGGNHFIYLVDSSVSMKEGFDSARRSLLESIGLLKPDQRFYVIFFDNELKFMRLSDSDVDEPRSVFATDENKAKLRRWSMTVPRGQGRVAYDDMLGFALEQRADVIFMLSDGEFPQSVEDFLKEGNRVTNLFGQSKPISIVHTIAYHSKAGETRMRRIAEQNQGQFRYVAKP